MPGVALPQYRDRKPSHLLEQFPKRLPSGIDQEYSAHTRMSDDVQLLLRAAFSSEKRRYSADARDNGVTTTAALRLFRLDSRK